VDLYSALPKETSNELVTLVDTKQDCLKKQFSKNTIAVQETCLQWRQKSMYSGLWCCCWQTGRVYGL